MNRGIRKLLTVTKVEKAKPREKAYKLADQRGMYLLVTPSGGKLWRWKFRVCGQEKLMALGKYPDVSLAKARERHQQARTLFAEGKDPMAERKVEKQAQRHRVEHTFRAVAHRWHNHWKQGRSPRHAAYVWSRLERDILPRLGTRPVGEITALEVRSMLQAISDRGITDLAKRAHQVVAQVFRFAISHEITQNDPASNFKPRDVLPATTKTNYARVSAKELPKLLQAIHVYPSLSTKLALQFMALTFVRTSELLGMKWEEIDWEHHRWEIPVERMKMKTRHLVPLSRQALAILEEMQSLSAGSAYVFPGRSLHHPMSNTRF
jgi:integrase